MVNSKTIATVAISVVLSLLGALALLGQGPTGPQGPAGNDGTFGLSNSDFVSQWIRVGGVTEWRLSTESLNSASSTICSIQTPAATSTIAGVSLRIDSGIPHTVEDMIIAHGNLVTASTTVLGTHETFGASDNGFLVASSSLLTNAAFAVAKPNTWINVKFSTTTTVGSTMAPVGKCSAVFREI